MIRRYMTRAVVSLVVLDQVVLLASLAAGLYLKTHWILPDPELPVRLHIDLFLRLWPLLAITLALSGAYDLSVAVGGLRPLLQRTLVGALAMAAVWMGGTFFFKLSTLFSYSRGVFGLFLGLAAVGLIAVRLGYTRFAKSSWNKSGRPRRVLVFGGEVLGQRIIQHLQKQVFVSVGSIEVTGDVHSPGVVRLSEEEAIKRIRQGEVDQIVVDLPPRRIRLIGKIAEAAEREGISLLMTPTIFDGMHLRPRVDQVGDVPVIELCGGELPLSGLLTKRALDVVLASVGLLVISPLLVVIATAVKLSSPGPIFFRQKRVGLGGRRFHILKFRTMVLDAEQQTGPVWAVTDDPRATRVGRFLRRTNFDELPQLFNVLAGTMSLVGPRPERPGFVEQFKPLIDRYSHKHWVKPGMTGWAQVNGYRGRTDLKRRIEHDIFYIERWSFWFDVRILALTLVNWAEMILYAIRGPIKATPAGPLSAEFLLPDESKPASSVPTPRDPANTAT